jgi:hypothetical protein
VNHDGPILLFDLETVPETASEGMDLNDPPQAALDATGLPEVPDLTPKPPPRNYKTPEAIAGHHEREAARLDEERASWGAKRREAAKAWYASGSLDPLRGRVLCLGYQVGRIDDWQPIGIFSGDEFSILTSFLRLLALHLPSQIVAHNGHGFDYPFVRVRAARHKLWPLSRALYQEKPWKGAGPLYDTIKEWPMSSSRDRRGSTKLGALATFLGYEGDNPIDGSQVLEAYAGGRLDEIVEHCRVDIDMLRLIYESVHKMQVKPAVPYRAGPMSID